MMDHGKEDGNYYIVDRGYIGIMEKEKGSYYLGFRVYSPP